MKREAKAQTTLGAYLKANKGPIGHGEVKATKTDVFKCNVFEDHQLQDLLALEEGPLYWKHSDMDARQKFADYSLLPPLPAYVVIKFPKCYTFIRVGEYTDFTRGKKSITLQEAKSIAEHIFA